MQICCTFLIYLLLYHYETSLFISINISCFDVHFICVNLAISTYWLASSQCHCLSFYFQLFSLFLPNVPVL